MANPCFAQNVWGHRSLMVVDKVSLVDILVDAVCVSWKMLFDILAQWVFVICPVFCFFLDGMCFSWFFF